uniref:Uncharacterized protein LOC105632180 n=1 Tax=Rhizophora mucronata TaxID=61149 RepID=A0A2P2L5U1_RHIMU
MDMNGKEANGFKKKPSITLESPKAEYQTDDGADYSDSNSLLPPRRGGMSRNSEKVPRKVQWNDKKGNKLVEVLEFEPSDAGDSDEEDTDSCFCSIM